jgi:hypothetical protein
LVCAKINVIDLKMGNIDQKSMIIPETLEVVTETTQQMCDVTGRTHCTNDSIAQRKHRQNMAGVSFSNEDSWDSGSDNDWSFIQRGLLNIRGGG